MSRLNRYVRGWGEYFKRAEVAGLFGPVRSLDHAAAASLRSEAVAQRALAAVPDQWFWFHLGLTRLYHLPFRSAGRFGGRFSRAPDDRAARLELGRASGL
jgi:Group II intron, maturase-specific domain